MMEVGSAVFQPGSSLTGSRLREGGRWGRRRELHPGRGRTGGGDGTGSCERGGKRRHGRE
jgi:hypothetical protein